MDLEVERLKQLLAQTEEALRAKEDELASKNLELVTKEAELTSKSEELASKVRELAKRDDEITLLKEQITALQKDKEPPQQLRRMPSRSDSINNLASYFEKRGEANPFKDQAGNPLKSMKRSLSYRKEVTLSTQEHCESCGKTVYLTERMAVDEKIYHKFCFRCAHCNNVLKLGNYAALQGKVYCKPHFKQLFKEKGNYNEGFGEQKLTELWAQRNHR